MSALETLAAFGSVVVLDFVWARYNLACAKQQPIIGGFYAAAILALGGFVVLQYTENPWLLIPATLGAFVGTSSSLWLSKWKDK